MARSRSHEQAGLSKGSRLFRERHGEVHELQVLEEEFCVARPNLCELEFHRLRHHRCALERLGEISSLIDVDKARFGETVAI
jgi:hypothetical protein